MESAAKLQKLNLDMSNLVEEESRVKSYKKNLKNQLRQLSQILSVKEVYLRCRFK